MTDDDVARGVKSLSGIYTTPCRQAGRRICFARCTQAHATQQMNGDEIKYKTELK